MNIPDTHSLHMVVGFVTAVDVANQSCDVQVEDEAGVHLLEDVGMIGMLTAQQQCLVFTADLKTWAMGGSVRASGKVATTGISTPVTVPGGKPFTSVVCSVDGTALYWLVNNGYQLVTVGAEITGANTFNILRYPIGGAGASPNALSVNVYWIAT